LDKALEAVLSTPPTTIAGVADSLDYVSRDDDADRSGGTIFENALDGGGQCQGLVENPACVVEGVRKAAADDRRDLALTHGAIIMTESVAGSTWPSSVFIGASASWGEAAIAARHHHRRC
jgi:hypothetical protein